jgi:hypothetical protein
MFPRTGASLAGVSLLLLLGCALGYLSPHYALPGERRQRLSDAANLYVSFLRFGNVEMAAPFVEPRLRSEFFAMFSEGGQTRVHFTDIDVENIEFTDLGKATVLVQARMYRLPSVREMPLMDPQQWRYDPGERTWYVSPNFALYSRDGAP